MNNPFSYTSYVVEQSFCNRQKEQKDLMTYIKGSQNVVLFSHRRVGKTSLIHQVFNKMNQNKAYQNIGKLYIDLYGTFTENEFISKLFSGFGQLESRVEKILSIAKDVFKSTRFTFSYDPASNSPSITPTFENEHKNVLVDEVLTALEKFSQKRKLVVVLDEFQEIAHYGDSTFEKKLRSKIQGHNNICYIFSGSQRHLLLEMFSSQKRAFYKLAEPYPLALIETRHYEKWITALFKKKKVTLNKELIRNIISRCENHPMYIQQFLFHFWEKDEISEKNIDSIEKQIIARRTLEFINLWESLTINQRKVLKLIIINNGKKMYQANSLQKINFSNTSQVAIALESLVKKDIISKNSHYSIQDIMFKKWIVSKILKI